MKSFVEIYKFIKSLLDFKEIIPQERICKKCNYKFNEDKSIDVCKDCLKELQILSPKRLEKLKKNYKKNPSKCPNCKKKMPFEPAQKKGGICPNCKEVQYY